MRATFVREPQTKAALAGFLQRASRLSMGPVCRRFEKSFAGFQARREAALFNSGASANLALLQALRNLGRLKAGDAIGFSAVTWSTNVMPIIQMGMIPVPIDCSPATLNVMSDNIRKRLRQVRLKALFLTNALGFTGDLPAIRSLARSHGLLLLEDNCESLGTILPEGRAGNFGLASTFSFFVGHHMSTIEGGMVCTDDAELSEMLRIVRANGWDRQLTPAQVRRRRREHHVDRFQAKYTFYDLAFNQRPTEITGFLGLQQLRGLAARCLRRQANYLAVERIIRINPDFLPLERSHLKLLSSFCFPVLCRNSRLRGRYLARLERAGVEVRPIIAGNIQRQPFYAKYVRARYPLPGADFIHDCGFYCGNYPDLRPNDIEAIRLCLTQ
ncbi:MAG TPA: DegT/DnrJ/EryC1/StrS aminotransferase [Elusimicrobia bacterium]|nr:DegT/DnrJ/EryC1/StrS aminotransferase [Elusimicrobiota bacterium]HBT60278.1 DegT/DnrJ/EryC1/StrS aminotransferase [Elusimicrobiota bacterium]